MIGKGYRSAILAYDRVRPVGVSQVPQWAPAADRGQCDKVFVRRRRRCSPFECPCVPGLSPATLPRKNEVAKFQTRMSAAALIKKTPLVESMFIQPQCGRSG